MTSLTYLRVWSTVHQTTGLSRKILYSSFMLRDFGVVVVLASHPSSPVCFERLYLSSRRCVVMHAQQPPSRSCHYCPIVTTYEVHLCNTTPPLDVSMLYICDSVQSSLTTTTTYYKVSGQSLDKILTTSGRPSFQMTPANFPPLSTTLQPLYIRFPHYYCYYYIASSLFLSM